MFLARSTYRQRRIRDAARLAPFLGAILWLLPLFWGAEDSTRTSDVLVYLFGAWVLLIGLSFLLSRWITPDPGDEGEAD